MNRSKVIKVTIQGEVSDYNTNRFSERLAIILLKELGEENCKELMRFYSQRDSKKIKVVCSGRKYNDYFCNYRK